MGKYFEYTYQIKNVSDRMNIDLRKEKFSIENAIKDIFGNKVLCKNINSKYFEFHINYKATKQELQQLGRKIVINSGHLNNFKRNNRLFERTLCKHYYGFVETVYNGKDNDMIAIYDVIPKLIFDYCYGIYEENREIEIFTKIKGHTVESINKEFTEEDIYSWHEIFVKDGAGTPEDGEYGEAESVVFRQGVNINKGYGFASLINKKLENKDLAKVYDLNKISDKRLNEKEVKEKIDDKLKGVKVDAIRIVDVGQGNCNELISNEQSMVVFDIGTGFGANFNSTYYKKRLNLNSTKIIILSHWDKDHWYLVEENPESYDKVWIAPYQKVGVQAFNVAYEVLKKGELIIVDAMINSINLNMFSLLMASGSNVHRHNNGISLAVEFNNKKVFLTGDNRYSYLQNKIPLEITHLLASHHGGKYSTTNTNRPASNSQVI